MTRAAIFDLDGTLIDSLADIGKAMNATLRDFGFPEHPLEEYKKFIGDGVRALAERSFPKKSFSSLNLDACATAYRQHYAAVWDQQTRLYPGIAELLDALDARGIRLAIFSNKPHDATAQCHGRFLSKWPFSAVIGQSDETPRKPDPAGALRILSAFNISPAEAVYVGDTATDLETARRAGIPFIGVAWGFRPEEITEYGIPVAKNPMDLLRWIS